MMLPLSSGKHSTLTAKRFDVKTSFELIGPLVIFNLDFFYNFCPGMKIILHYTNVMILC